MRQFDIVALANGSFALVLQADLLDQFAWRVVAPLVPAKGFTPARKLHLPVRLAGRDYFAVIDKFSMIHLRHMTSVVGSLKDCDWDIRCALDLAFVGV